jgi:hypothetical protein
MNTSEANRTTNSSFERRSAIATRTPRGIGRAITVILASRPLLFLMLFTGVMGSSSAPNAEADAGPGRFVTSYGNTIQQVEYGLTPESVGVTSDGGYIALALTDSRNGVGVNWVLKLGASGRPQWQREIGCASGAPGDYTFAVSAQEASDGGYILGGGVVGCGSYPQRALVEKLDALGRVIWAFAYSAGTADSAITKITPTADGGYIAVGSARARASTPARSFSSSTAEVLCSGSGSSGRPDRPPHSSMRSNRPPTAATWRSENPPSLAGTFLIP